MIRLICVSRNNIITHYGTLNTGKLERSDNAVYWFLLLACNFFGQNSLQQRNLGTIKCQLLLRKTIDFQWPFENLKIVLSFLCLKIFTISDHIADASFVNGEEAGGKY